MIQLLRPGYTAPNRKQLSGPLLDVTTNKIDKLMAEELDNDRPITLLQDGWSSVRNDPIIATSIHTGIQSYLLSAVDCKAEKKTAEYCFELADDAIKQCHTKYNKKVFAICTDNENKMKKMRELVSEKYPHIITYGCSAHYLNLVEKEVTPKTVLKHIIEIQKFFRNHHQPLGLVKDKKGKIPQLPNETRWNSLIACVDTFIENYSIYRDILSENEELFETERLS